MTYVWKLTKKKPLICPLVAFRAERVLHGQPAGPNPLFHRDDLVDQPRAMGV
jgi:hypothetical protein